MEEVSSLGLSIGENKNEQFLSKIMGIKNDNPTVIKNDNPKQN